MPVTSPFTGLGGKTVLLASHDPIALTQDQSHLR